MGSFVEATDAISDGVILVPDKMLRESSSSSGGAPGSRRASWLADSVGALDRV